MQRQIELYYTNNLKYLKLGEYQRFFKQESIDEMLNCIKDKETPVKIRASKDDIKRHKLSDGNKVFYSYEVLPDKPVFGKNPVENILQHFIESKADFMDYSVIDMWQDKLGKLIFICNSKEKKDEILDENVYLAFLPPDLEELQKGMIKENAIPESVVNSIFNIV